MNGSDVGGSSMGQKAGAAAGRAALEVWDRLIRMIAFLVKAVAFIVMLPGAVLASFGLYQSLTGKDIIQVSVVDFAVWRLGLQGLVSPILNPDFLLGLVLLIVAVVIYVLGHVLILTLTKSGASQR